MSKAGDALRRLRAEVRLALAAWLVSKAVDLTPETDTRTLKAFHALFSAMVADDEGRGRCREWEREAS